MSRADRPLTRRQWTVLSSLEFGNGRTAKWLGVRSDVLWRLEQRGLVSRNLHDRWRITDKGQTVLENTRWEDAT
jgi:hypothetical protein